MGLTLPQRNCCKRFGLLESEEGPDMSGQSIFQCLWLLWSCAFEGLAAGIALFAPALS
jgi:hypothetical protein